MTPGGTGFIYGANTVGNQGGGNKKQGLPPTIGRAGWLSNFISSNSGGYFRGIPAAAAGPVDPCPTNEKTDDQIVSTQVQAELLRGVTKITGNLRITGNITDWSPFDCLKHITGDFKIIGNHDLISISGFGRLETIGGYFNIISNNALETISGFGSLTSVGGDFEISGNLTVATITISGFGRLETIGGEWNIANNSALETITGFDNLATIGDYFYIESNDALTEISGFGSLTTLSTVYITRNDKLTKISGFDNLATIEDGFTIRNNDELTDASGLGKVESVGGSFYFYENTQFTNTAFADLVASLISIVGNIQVFGNNVANDFDAPGDLKWGVGANRTLNNLTIGSAQLGTNSFGGLNNPPQTTALFALPFSP
jgi:hypothetical protein